MSTIINKWDTTLIYFVLIYLLINITFFIHLNLIDEGSGLIYIFIFPIFWFVYLTIVAVFAYKNRATLFTSERKNTTILLILLCTPISILIIMKIIGLLIDPIANLFFN